jgi:hypothetical protein
MVRCWYSSGDPPAATVPEQALDDYADLILGWPRFDAFVT